VASEIVIPDRNAMLLYDLFIIVHQVNRIVALVDCLLSYLREVVMRFEGYPWSRLCKKMTTSSVVRERDVNLGFSRLSTNTSVFYVWIYK
jgi:hypothetical protein